MHRVLNTCLVQHLGKVTFALYLVHGPVMHMGSYWVPHLVWRVVAQNQKDMDGWLAVLIVGWIVNLRVGAVGCGCFSLGGCGEEHAVDSVD
jgi:peptidoglycan/LPS O-acetylase OafA/YrhL